jgi:hypothetical protein
VESSAAQVFRGGLDRAAHIHTEKAHLPVHVGPRPLPALWASRHKVMLLLHFPCHRKRAFRLPEMRVPNNLSEVLTFFQLHPVAM